MACSLSTLAIALLTVFSKKSTDTAMWIPVTGYLSTTGWTKVRTQIEVRSQTAGLVIQWGYQTANDQASPDAATAVGVASDGNEGVFNSTGYTDISTNTNGKMWVRFGLLIKNSSGTNQELGLAGGRVDFG